MERDEREPWWKERIAAEVKGATHALSASEIEAVLTRLRIEEVEKFGVSTPDEDELDEEIEADAFEAGGELEIVDWAAFNPYAPKPPVREASVSEDWLKPLAWVTVGCLSFAGTLAVFGQGDLGFGLAFGAGLLVAILWWNVEGD
jgi:hypothetical protein